MKGKGISKLNFWVLQGKKKKTKLKMYNYSILLKIPVERYPG